MFSLTSFIRDKSCAVWKACFGDRDHVDQQVQTGSFLFGTDEKTLEKFCVEKRIPSNKLSVMVPPDTEAIKQKFHLENLQRIGGGGFGEVFVGTDITDPSKRFALKVISSKYVSKAAYKLFREDVKREIYFTQKLNHPNVVAIESWTWMALTNLRQGRAAIKMELLDIDLYTLVRYTPLSYKHTNIMAQQIGLALAYLHEQQVAHHDISSSNVMATPFDLNQPHASQLDSPTITWKLVDLGVAKLYDKPQEVAVDSFPWRAGQTFYFSIEKNLATAYQPFKADAFAFGVLCLESLMGREELKAQVSLTKRMHTTAQQLYSRQKAARNIEKQKTLKVILKLLDRSQNDRWLVKQAMPYFQQLI